MRDGYELRTIAILNEDTLKVTLIPDEADDVPGQYIVEGKGVDYIQFYPDTLVGNILPAEQAMKMFRKKKK